MASQTKKFWTLLDSVTTVQSEQMTTKRLQDVILKIPEKERTRFFLWTEGWENWQSLKEYLVSQQKDFKLEPDDDDKTKILDSQAPAKTKVQMSDLTLTGLKPSQQDFNGDSLELNSNADQHKKPAPLDFKKLTEPYANRSERHELQIEVLLINQKSRTFKSVSKNISLTGSRLIDNIPFDFYSEPFDLVLSNRNASQPALTRVQLRAEIVGEGLSQRIQFVNQSPQQKEKLIHFLNEFTMQQKHLKKATG